MVFSLSVSLQQTIIIVNPFLPVTLTTILFVAEGNYPQLFTITLFLSHYRQPTVSLSAGIKNVQTKCLANSYKKENLWRGRTTLRVEEMSLRTGYCLHRRGAYDRSRNIRPDWNCYQESSWTIHCALFSDGWICCAAIRLQLCRIWSQVRATAHTPCRFHRYSSTAKQGISDSLELEVLILMPTSE